MDEVEISDKEETDQIQKIPEFETCSNFDQGLRYLEEHHQKYKNFQGVFEDVETLEYKLNRHKIRALKFNNSLDLHD